MCEDSNYAHGKVNPARSSSFLLVLVFFLPLAIQFLLGLFRFRINAMRGIFLLRLLLVFVTLALVGGLFHDRLDGGHSSCVAPPGLGNISPFTQRFRAGLSLFRAFGAGNRMTEN